MNDDRGIADTEPHLTLARTMDVRHADNDLENTAAWIANLIRRRPGALVDLTDHGNHANRIHIKIESPNDDRELTT
jgi:hypothetical protein